jgi:hypothetical protein
MCTHKLAAGRRRDAHADNADARLDGLATGVRLTAFSACMVRSMVGVKFELLLDNILIFTRIRGSLNIKDQVDRSAHKEVRPTSNISKVIT